MALARKCTNCLAMVHQSVHNCQVQYEELARGVLRALRGRRSQVAFSRRLGYRTNVAYTWESGRRFPTAAETFRAATKVGIDVRQALEPFFRRLPDELRTGDPVSPAFVATLLRAVRSKGSMQALATNTGLSRSAISRILSGKTEPRLPTFFRLVDAASRRLLDLLSGFVDVASIPAARDEWRRLEALRRLAFDNPLSEAVPRFLELEQYERLPRHRSGWIAERLGVSRGDEERTLRDLEQAGVVAFDGSRYRLDQARSVDTTRDPRAAIRLRQYWIDLARARITAAGEGVFSYLVFGTDDATYAAIQELQLRYFREMRTLVRHAPTSTRVVVANMHLFPIDVGAPR
jgi:DNA-binding phage protein